MSNFWNKPKSLHQLTDEIVNRPDSSQYPYEGGGAVPQPPGVGGLGAAQNSGLLGRLNYGQSAPGSPNPRPDPNQPSPTPQPKDTQGAKAFLDGLSSDELRQLKNALSSASRKTQALTILLGGALVVLNPVSWLVLIPVFTGIAALTFDEAAAEIDKRLDAR